MLKRYLRLLLDPVAGEGGGSTPPAVTPPAPAEGNAPDLAKAVQGLIAKHGSGDAALLKLVTENYEYRDQLRDVKAKVPGEGSRVLSPAEVQVLEAYRALGEPEQLKTIKAEHGQFGTELSTVKRDAELRTFAEKAGVQFEVLKTLAGSRTFTTVKVKDEKTGQESEVPAVKDGEAEPVPFAKFADEHWKAFLPSLLLSAQATKPGVPARRTAAPMPPVTPPGKPAVATGIRMPRV